MERFAKLAAAALSQVLPSPIEASDLETPPDPTLGDFGYPCFKLSKEFKKSPPQVAEQLVKDLLAKNCLPSEVTVAAVGPYVNFTTPSDLALKTLLKDILENSTDPQGNYGRLPEGSRGNWVLEYSSPNVAKPLNIYHLRTTALGAALDRMGRFRGFKVTSINHLGDWGKQYGMLSIAFKKYGIDLARNLSMKDLVDLYVKINADAEKEPELHDQAREAFVKLEKGDAEISKVWKKCVEISMKEFDRMYARLGVRFDHVWGESFYSPRLAPLIEDLKKMKLLVESEGAQIVEVTTAEGKKLPPCIIQKSDGATIYATRDIAAAIYRKEKLHFDRMTYIVGGEQKLHFQQIFAVLRQMKMEWITKCEHVPTGLYRFKDAKMSTRKGNFVTLEEVLDFAKERVATLMQERAADPENQGRHEVPTAEITEAVALGAVVFHDLSTDPARDVEFDVNRVVDFEGETGPYLQYAHTRCKSILRKAEESKQMSKGGISALFSESAVRQLKISEEIRLVKMLGMFPFHLERALRYNKASQLAHYLIDVTKTFGAFYRECHVLDQEPELTQARLMLVESTRRILARGLNFLGIPLPERM